MDAQEAKKNTDRELWRRVKDDYYSPSVHVTEGDGIGINVGGMVYVMPVEAWHNLAAHSAQVEAELRQASDREWQHYPACNTIRNQPIRVPGCICVITYKKRMGELEAAEAELVKLRARIAELEANNG
jgi:hypothetical protein